MAMYAYLYSYIDNELQGKAVDVHEYLTLTASPGIYYVYNGKWSVLEVTEFGSFNSLHKMEVPNEVKIHHLLTQ